ncbi:hypothetical protein OCJ37_18355 [Xanthomonas sp. AM6]|uniref:hypothetical protein n=1 Tax=Xanthomonas sp. AM6 TaxID=2982531 RepID=UPI0021D8876F|nr:hypothetical protein [Xanthomonas sp. AM6]UYB51909.1 hypothetical protein OCJ37_18355 [Xanthomonas sp. AM6]
MSPGSSKRNQSSPPHQDSGYWFDLPDIKRRNARRQRVRLVGIALAVAAALLMFVLFGDSA